MTINELDQGIRNLIASQPMLTAGANGEVINGINSLIDAYRNLSFRVQSYPCQDVVKFGLSNEFAKQENTFTSLAVQVLQERGINIMLYIPRSSSPYMPTMNNYGMVNTTIDPNAMMGQMMYNAPMGQAAPQMMNMPNMSPARSMGVPEYNTLQPTMSGIAVNGYGPRQQTRKPAATFPGYPSVERPVHIEPSNMQSADSVKTRSAPQAKIKPEAKAAAAPSATKTVVQPAPVEPTPAPAAAGPSPAEMLMGGALGGSGGKAPGRDYLLELLKK